MRASIRGVWGFIGLFGLLKGFQGASKIPLNSGVDFESTWGLNDMIPLLN